MAELPRVVEDAVQLNFRKQDFCVLIFQDETDLFWGGFLAVVDMAHQPIMGLVSGELKGLSSIGL